MPRDKEAVRRRLQRAALAIFQERGYESATAAEIAAEAGVTERTFFRHFPDKREVLFDGGETLSALLTGAVRDAPTALGPWHALLRAFRSAERLFGENRPFSEQRRRIIDGSPALRERELAKVRSLVGALAAALRDRGLSERSADLAAQIGVAALGHAHAAWLGDDARAFGEHLEEIFDEVCTLTTTGPEPTDLERQGVVRSVSPAAGS